MLSCYRHWLKYPSESHQVLDSGGVFKYHNNKLIFHIGYDPEADHTLLLDFKNTVMVIRKIYNKIKKKYDVSLIILRCDKSFYSFTQNIKNKLENKYNINNIQIVEKNNEKI